MLQGALQRGGRALPVSGQAAVAISVLYRSYLSGLVAYVVPDHTRDAAFQLYCDLRTNTPKDRRFVLRHAHSLAPRTAPGWLALASALGFSLSCIVALACTTIVISIAGVWALAGLAVAAGMFLASVLSVLAFSLFVSALLSGAVAWGALMMYVCATATLACLRLAGRLVLGPPRSQPGMLQASNTGVTGADQPQPSSPLALSSIRTKAPPSNLSSSLPAAGAADSPSTAAGSPRRLHPAAAAAAALAEPHIAAPAVAPSVPEETAAAAGSVRPSPFVSTTTPAAAGASSAASDRPRSRLSSGSTGIGPSPLKPNDGNIIDGGATPPPAASGAPKTPTSSVDDTSAATTAAV